MVPAALDTYRKMPHTASGECPLFLRIQKTLFKKRKREGPVTESTRPERFKKRPKYLRDYVVGVIQPEVNAFQTCDASNRPIKHEHLMVRTRPDGDAL